MSKRIQKVTGSINFADGIIIETSVEGTNDSNLQSKLTAWLRQALIGYNFDKGGTITFKIEPVVADEFVREEI